MNINPQAVLIIPSILFLHMALKTTLHNLLLPDHYVLTSIPTLCTTGLYLFNVFSSSLYNGFYCIAKWVCEVEQYKLDLLQSIPCFPLNHPTLTVLITLIRLTSQLKPAPLHSLPTRLLYWQTIPARSYQRDHVSRVQKRLSAQHVVRCWPKRLLLSVELAVGIGSPRSGHSLAKCPSLPQENHFGRGGGIGACLVIGGIPPKERQPVGGWPICRPTKMAAFTLSQFTASVSERSQQAFWATRIKKGIRVSFPSSQTMLCMLQHHHPSTAQSGHLEVVFLLSLLPFIIPTPPTARQLHCQKGSQSLFHFVFNLTRSD